MQSRDLGSLVCFVRGDSWLYPRSHPDAHRAGRTAAHPRGIRGSELSRQRIPQLSLYHPAGDPDPIHTLAGGESHWDDRVHRAADGFRHPFYRPYF